MLLTAADTMMSDSSSSGNDVDLPVSQNVRMLPLPWTKLSHNKNKKVANQKVL
jgi:hypothetical protein